MQTYDTVTEAINALSTKGYTRNFNLSNDCLLCGETQTQLKASEFEIDEVYRFEGETDPGDEMIVYAISSYDGLIKGTLVNAYGMYSDSLSAELVAKLKQIGWFI